MFAYITQEELASSWCTDAGVSDHWNLPTGKVHSSKRAAQRTDRAGLPDSTRLSAGKEELLLLNHDSSIVLLALSL